MFGSVVSISLSFHSCFGAVTGIVKLMNPICHPLVSSSGHPNMDIGNAYSLVGHSLSSNSNNKLRIQVIYIDTDEGQVKSRKYRYLWMISFLKHAHGSYF